MHLVSCPKNNLLDPPADFRAGQGAPTSHSGHYGEEAQRRPARKDAAQRVSYVWDRTLPSPPQRLRGLLAENLLIIAGKSTQMEESPALSDQRHIIGILA